MCGNSTKACSISIGIMEVLGRSLSKYEHRSLLNECTIEMTTCLLAKSSIESGKFS